MKSKAKTHLLAGAVFTSCLALAPGLTPESHADALPAAQMISQEDQGPRANDILSELLAVPDKSARQQLATELAELRPFPTEVVAAHLLKRERGSSDAERRAILTAVGAQVPDENGRFKIPKRMTAKQRKERDEFDWFGGLAKQSKSKGLGDLLSDVAAIRALAATTDPEAGHAILDFAFSETGLAYRDECGRYLRKMSPYSLPALIHGSQDRKDQSKKRYSAYQLERLDRQDAHKAFGMAPNDEMRIAILKAYADSQYREAVFTVLNQVNHVSPAVRATARAAWMEYVDGREPPKPPERKLEMPNGKLSDEPEPLWLDHRALADEAIRKRIKELKGAAPSKRATLVQMSEELFAHYDEERQRAQLEDFEAALALAKGGKHEEAVEGFDRILAARPDFGRKAEMMPSYLAIAESLEAEKKWDQAAIAYSKASLLSPDSPEGKAALKKHHLARAKNVEAEGGDASEAIAMANKVESDSSESGGKSKLMLFGGIAAIGGAILLFGLAMVMRRRPAGAR